VTAVAPRTFAAPKGVPEYTPPDSAGFEHVRDTLLTAADRAGYGLIELPVFEDTGLYARGVGESTDVVSKEMYTFLDRGERSVTLRPEGTAGVVRAVIEHGLDRAGLPVKLRYAGPFFRYERPQAGRYRQLQQVGIEAIGVDDPALDARSSPSPTRATRRWGSPATGWSSRRWATPSPAPPTATGSRSSWPGCRSTSPPGNGRRINPLRVLDDKRADGARAARRRAAAGRPPLARRGRAPRAGARAPRRPRHRYVENPRMVRGLDYYTKTTFEFVHDGPRRAVRHRWRRPLRRADGYARRARRSPGSGSGSASTARSSPAAPKA
jgi:histidyl-tRNA synthetase